MGDKKNHQHCIKCGYNKPISDFLKNSKTISGYGKICKECRDNIDINLTGEEVKEKIIELDEIFYSDPLIIHNSKIANNRVFTKEDKYQYFLSRGYHKIWLQIIYGLGVYKNFTD